MNRRQLLRASACMLGYFSSWATAARSVPVSPDGGMRAQQKVIAPDDLQLVASIAETIIPATATPGAIDAGVPAFIQEIYAEWFTDAERSQFLAGLASLNNYAQGAFQQPFTELTPAQQYALLTRAMDTTGLGDSTESLLVEFLQMIRELVVIGYFMSEAGARKALAYNPVPMRYIGEYDLDQINKQWSY